MMSDSKRFYTGKDLAALYSTARAKLPDKILAVIEGYLSENFDLRDCVAVDVGCGSGQSSIPVAKRLKHVTGVDVSEDQIKEGNRLTTQPNVCYKVGCAENLPVADASVHLVLASNAAHWFDMPAFIKEVDRVLMPNGVLAISTGTPNWSYKTERDVSKMPQMCELADDINDDYWSVITQIVPMIDKLELPYGPDVRKEKHMIPENISIAALMDRVKSFAAVSQMMIEKPKEAEARLEDFQDRFMKFAGSKSSPEETELTLTWLYLLCLTRKPNLN